MIKANITPGAGIFMNEITTTTFVDACDVGELVGY